MKKKLLYQVFAVIMMATFLVTGCGQSGNDSKASKSSQRSEAKASDKEKVDAPEIPELTFERTMDLTYAKEFDVYYYKDGYKLIDVHEDRQYLIVPEGKEAPEGLDEDIVVIKQPVQNIYMAATATMSLFDRLDALDTISFSGLEASGWYVENAKEAMESGEITYAGKYSEPDYEKIVDGDCSLAIESTMILHTPKVQEMIEELGIPVFVDYSSYEKKPLGRTEWVKLYGLLSGKEEEATAAFDREKEAFEQISQDKATGKTVAFFYITSNGEVNVRKASDYLPKMIEMAGGSYILKQDEEDDSVSSTMSMDMESFYAAAKDADYIIYNSTVDGEISTVDELTEKSGLLEHFKAVEEGNVYCTSKNLYQSTMKLGSIISDLYKILHGEEDTLTYIYRLE